MPRDEKGRKARKGYEIGGKFRMGKESRPGKFQGISSVEFIPLHPRAHPGLH